MKLTFRHLFIFLCVITRILAQRETTTFISPHSPTINAARELVGWQRLIHEEDHGIVFALVPEVNLTFKRNRIAQCLFGNSVLECKSSCFTVSGSLRPDRCSSDWLADYFALSPDFKSTVHISPDVSTVLFHLYGYFDFSYLCSGLYAQFHIPAMYSRWTLSVYEFVENPGSLDYAPGYVNQTGVARANLASQFIDYASGCFTPTIQGITYDQLQHSRLSLKSLRKASLAEIECMLGYIFFLSPEKDLRVDGRILIPGGNKAQGTFLFEPINGNGHHWEFGTSISGHYRLWHNECTQEAIQWYAQLITTYIIGNIQCRTFDLCNGPNSRYMTALLFDTPIQDNLSGQQNSSFITPQAQFNQRIAPVANITTLPVHVSPQYQIDFATMIVYDTQAFSWMFGGGFWRRGCDDIELVCPFKDNNKWALKGDAQVFGFIADEAIPLSATQSQATITAGRNRVGGITFLPQAQTNPRIDRPLPAFADPQNTGTQTSLTSQPNGTNFINTSIQPRLINKQDLDIRSVQTKGNSYNIFSHVNYTWYDCSEFLPYLGIGAQVEFGSAEAPNKDGTKKECTDCSLSIWHFWLKGGVAF